MTNNDIEKNSTNKEKSSHGLSSSYRFPSKTLDSCLAKIQTLFMKNSTNTISTQAIMADLGFVEGSGGGSTVLAAMKYYGLLVQVNGKYKIADFIIDYCISGTLTQDMVFICLSSVPVNKKIFSIYDFYNLPGDNEIKSSLIKICDYNLTQANGYINTFNKNKELYDSVLNAISVAAPTIEKNEENALEPQTDTPVWKFNKNCVITYPLRDCNSITIQLPKDIKELESDDLEDIKDVLELILKKINKQLDK